MPPLVTSARLAPYSLAFATPWRSSRRTHTRRSGWIVTIEDAAGGAARGECAPWPDAGTESAECCEQTLQTVLPALPGLPVADALSGLESLSAVPAARCGLEAALLGLEARARGMSVRRLLAADAADVIGVNAVLGAADASLPAAAQAAIAAGFKVLKIKLGVGAWDQELATLRALNVPPGCALRLDANGAWDADTAARRLADIGDLPVEAVEEPLQRYEPELLSGLQAAVEFPLALDESLVGHAAEILSRGCPVRRLVLKPMVLGGAGATLAVARRARAAGLEIVVTTTLEAATGRWLAAAVAAASGSLLAHGLDTGRWLAGDLDKGPAIADGQLRFDNGP